jgi:copper chaperone
VTINHEGKSTREDFTKMLHSIGYPEATEENGLLLQLKSYISCAMGRIKV